MRIDPVGWLDMITVEVWNEIRDPIVESETFGFRLVEEIFVGDQFPSLRMIDPYGYTVFNGAQCVLLRKEVLALMPKLRSADRSVFEMILQLIDLCTSQGHNYLVFDGD
jgi:hypothetical protein